MLRKNPPLGLLLISAGFIVTAQIFDLNLVIPVIFGCLEELFEMNGALTLVFASFMIRDPFILTNASNDLRKSSLMKNMPSLIGIILTCFFLLSLVFIYPFSGMKEI